MRCAMCRSCTDVICLLIFIIFVVAFIGVGGWGNYRYVSLNALVPIYTVFQKKFIPRTFMITV